jgi:hypothetical protein
MGDDERDLIEHVSGSRGSESSEKQEKDCDFEIDVARRKLQAKRRESGHSQNSEGYVQHRNPPLPSSAGGLLKQPPMTVLEIL